MENLSMPESQPPTFETLAVRITDFDPKQQAYPVEVTLQGERNFQGWLRLQGLTLPAEGSAQEIRAYGTELFRRLFADSLAAAFQQAWGSVAQEDQQRLRVQLWLDSADPTLHAIPWELLHYNPGVGAGAALPLTTDLKVAFSRYLASSEAWGKPITRRPLRMLIVIAAPSDLGTEWPDLVAIDKGAEQSGIEDLLKPLTASGHLVYEFLLPRTSEETLEAALAKGYDLVLYFGHALQHPEYGARLVLEDHETGLAALYAGSELLRFLQQTAKRPSLFILIACNTAQTTAMGGNAPVSLGSALVQQGGIPAVVAMQRLVDLSFARTFTQYLCDSLLREGGIDVAVTAARQRLFQADSFAWSTPVLYLRSRDGQLFSPNARLEYSKALHANPQFAHWQGPDFIRMEAAVIPAGQHDWLIRNRPEDAAAGSDLMDAVQQALQRQPLEVDGVLQPNLTVVLGPPRSGLTANMQRLAWMLAADLSTGTMLNAPVPIYVPLEKYQQDRGNNCLERLILDAVKEVNPTLSNELNHRFHLAEAGRQETLGPTVFILDGLDSITGEQRLKASTEILDLAHRFPHYPIVVSCIYNLFPSGVFTQALILLLRRLSERQILRYLRERNLAKSTIFFRQIVEKRLLDLASDPNLLKMIYERLSNKRTANFTRNQLLHEMLAHALEDLASNFAGGDAARKTVIALAWRMRSTYHESLNLAETFAVMAEVRQQRDYSLEGLFQALSDVGLLTTQNLDQVRFTYPILQAYCAALAMQEQPDFQKRLDKIVTDCCVTKWRLWWGDTLYILVGLLESLEPLRLIVSLAATENISVHTLLLARCLETLSPQAASLLTAAERQELFDTCISRLHVEREPSEERRALLATALGRLKEEQVVGELRRLLMEKVRIREERIACYDYATVRIAAARALLLLTVKAPALVKKLEPALMQLLVLWARAAYGQDNVRDLARAALGKTLANQTASPLARTVAAIALADLAYTKEDAQLILNVIVGPEPVNLSTEEWSEALWAMTEALYLFEASDLEQLLVTLLRQEAAVPPQSSKQIAYIVGRVRTKEESVATWLLESARLDLDLKVKAIALRSITWIGVAAGSFDWLLKARDASDLGKLRHRSATAAALPPLTETRNFMPKIMFSLVNWEPAALQELGFRFREEVQADAPETLNLRQTVIEALAWVGDQATLDLLEPQLAQWPLSLRNTWHLTARAIRSRLQK